MDVVIILGVVVAVLFAGAYMTKRRFGVLGLALAAGYVLSVIWSEAIATLALEISFDTGPISPVTLLTLTVILLPSVILLFGGPSYKKKHGRLVGALLYAVLAVIFSLGALEHTLVLMGQGKLVYETVVEYQQYILTAALIVAIADIMHARTSGGKKLDKHDKKH